MKELRTQLPSLKGWCFLNYAATAPLLLPSAERFCALVEQAKEPFLFHQDQWLVHLESARRSVADLIGASADEIAFVSNTSSGLSLIANAIRWKPGDRVLYPADEFSSNRFVWQNLKEKEVFAEALPPTSLLEYLNSIDLTNVRLLSLSAVSYLDGRLHPIEEIVHFCHARNILVAVDAIQAVGAIPIDVKRLQCDFLVCGGQKWLLGPVGTGFIYLKKELLPELFVPQIGWASIQNPLDFSSNHFEFAQGARRFEPGLPDIPAIAALATSIKTLSQVGWQKIYERIHYLTATLYEAVKEECITPLERAGILTLKTREAKKLQQELYEKKILVGHHDGFLRLSCHAPLMDEELAYFLEIYSKGKKRFAPLPTKSKKEPQKEQKWALILGATGSLGSALSKAAAKRGYALFLIARQKEKLEALALSLKENDLVDVKICPYDLAENAEVELPNDIELIINCAAESSANLFHESDLIKGRREFEVNFWAPLTFVQKALPSMLKKKRGAILNIVTSGARCALPLFSTYAASKGALWAWSEALQRELANTGVHVTTFLPPHMDSALATQLSRSAAGYYTLAKRNKGANCAEIAEKALTALDARKALVMPWKTRLKLMLNSCLPGFITRWVLKNKER